MKKTSKRLNLNRETLRSMDRDHFPRRSTARWPTDAVLREQLRPHLGPLLSEHAP